MKTFVCLFLCFSGAIALPLTDEDHLGMYGDKFEGDMILTPEQEKALLTGNKTGLVDESYRWPNKTVPYDFIDLSDNEKNRIRVILDKMEEHLCLKFVERTNQKDYIEVKNGGDGCFAAVGRNGGAQIVNLKSVGCIYDRIIGHEFIHALGFYHMQSASDRDNYVEIKWENIPDIHKHNFHKYHESFVSQLGVPYDYKSIMHYFPKAFSINGKETIVSKTNEPVAPSHYMTEKDIQRIRKMYC